MSRLIALVLGLFFAARVSVGNVPAPVPVLFAFAVVIAALLWLIFETAFVPVPCRRTA